MYGIGLFGGGFLQNELILEFPTKSMPSGFSCRGDPSPRASSREIEERLRFIVFIICGGLRACEAVLLPASPCAPPRRDHRGETTAMFYRSSIAAAAVFGALCVPSGDPQASGDSEYPAFSRPRRA